MKRRIFALLTLIALVSMACRLQWVAPLDPVSMTLTPLSELVASTATARAEEENASGGDLSTAIAKATAKSAEIYATQTAYASLNDASKLATATAIAPVVAELPRYGIKPDEGFVAWMHKPVTIELHGFQQTGFANDYPEVTAADFVMAADITWHTYNSDAGCGFMFRSNGDQKKPSQYSIIMTQTASGYVAFLATLDGKLGNIGTFFPKTNDKSFSWFNDSTNRLVIVVRGTLIDIYTNGTYIGQVDVTKPPPRNMPRPPVPQLPDNATQQQKQEFNQAMDQYNQNVASITAQFNEASQNFEAGKTVFTNGLLGLIALSQSGDATCKFDNTWLFIMKK